MKPSVEGAQCGEHQHSLADFSLCDIENVSSKKVLELLLPAGDATEQKNHCRRGDDERDADDRFLWDGLLRPAACQAEKRRPQESHSERDPERDSIFEVISHKQRDAGTQRCNLCKCEIDEDHFAFDDVQPEVDEQRWEQQGGYEWPLHDLPRQPEIPTHFAPPSA